MAASNRNPAAGGTARGASEAVHPGRANVPKLTPVAPNFNRPSFVPRTEEPRKPVMSGIRERLPNRRASLTFEIMAGGLNYRATVSRFDDGRVAEIFLTNHKVGSHADTAAEKLGGHLLDCVATRRAPRNSQARAVSRRFRQGIRSARLPGR